jgi:hypothetical protein
MRSQKADIKGAPKYSITMKSVILSTVSERSSMAYPPIYMHTVRHTQAKSEASLFLFFAREYSNRIKKEKQKNSRMFEKIPIKQIPP